MSDSDRPILSPWDIEELGVELHEIEARHWVQLSELQVGITQQDGVFALVALAGKLGPPKPPEPQQPLRLTNALWSYSQQMFDVEASKYPDDPQLEHWLLKLAEKVSDRVMRGVRAVEANGKPWKSLAHHGLTEERMRTIAGDALKSSIAKWLEKKRATPPDAKRLSPPIAPAKPPASISAVRPVKDQIAALIEETRLTNEKMAEGVGLNVRTPYRHVSGEFAPGKRTVAKYEQFFSRKLGRPVRIDMPPKRQRKVSKKS
jgi:hypothetical protein